MQDDVEVGAVDMHAAVVLDQAELRELVHKETDA